MRRGWWYGGVSFILYASLSFAADPPAMVDTFADTWTATDGLGRTVPGHEQVGPPRDGKFVGMFYFLWLGRL